MQEYCEVYIYGSVPFKRYQNPIVDGLAYDTGISVPLASEMNLIKTISKNQLPKMELEQDLVYEADELLVYQKIQKLNSIPNYVVYKIRPYPNSVAYRYYYYYVDKIEWNAMSSVKLKLRMDTLNTYKSVYKLSKKTRIYREHRDRIYIDETLKNDGDDYYEATMHVDRISEGLTFPLFKSNQDYIDDSSDTKDYLLLYRSSSETEDTGISTYYYPSTAGTYNNTTSSITLNKTDLNSLATKVGALIGGSIHLFFTSFDNGGATITCIDSGGTYHTYTLSAGFIGVEYYKNRTTGTSKIHIRGYTTLGSINYDYDDAQGIILQNTYFARLQVGITSQLILPITGQKTESDINAIPSTYTFLTKTGNQVVRGYSDLRRNDPLNIKAIYIPYGLNFGGLTNQTYDAQLETWRLNYTALINGDYVKKIVSNTDSPIKQMLYKFRLTTTSAMRAANRNDNNESKMYHSDFYQYKICYDTSYWVLKYENLEEDLLANWTFYYTTEPYLTFEFGVSSMLSSTFIFNFLNIPYEYEEEDFPYTLISMRNNETILTSNSYIEYIKNGFNFDQKAKEQQLKSQMVGGTLGAISSIIGIVGGVASQNYPLVAMSSIGLGSSIASSGANMAISQESNNNSIANKLISTELQGTSVKAVSDIDIFKRYSKNKLFYAIYQLRGQERDLLEDLFYYKGYRVDDCAIPNTTSRLWFNYIQADIVFDNTSDGNIDERILEDIKRQYAEGITHFHCVSDSYNFAQTKENWERNIYDIVESNE